jgi:hypothetical protein
MRWVATCHMHFLSAVLRCFLRLLRIVHRSPALVDVNFTYAYSFHMQFWMYAVLAWMQLSWQGQIHNVLKSTEMRISCKCSLQDTNQGIRADQHSAFHIGLENAMHCSTARMLPRYRVSSKRNSTDWTKGVVDSCDQGTCVWLRTRGLQNTPAATRLVLSETPAECPKQGCTTIEHNLRSSCTCNNCTGT